MRVNTTTTRFFIFLFCWWYPGVSAEKGSNDTHRQLRSRASEGRGGAGGGAAKDGAKKKVTLPSVEVGSPLPTVTIPPPPTTTPPATVTTSPPTTTPSPSTTPLPTVTTPPPTVTPSPSTTPSPTTTPPPTVTTPLPTTTPSPTMTPPPTVMTPSPTVMTPPPTVMTSPPTAMTPEPTVTTSPPTVTTSPPTAMTPEPTVTTSPPTVMTPEPTAMTPAPTVTTPPAPAAPAPAPFSCNVCVVPGTSVSFASKEVEFEGNTVTCAALEASGINGGITDDATCASAQSLAQTSCACELMSTFQPTQFCGNDASLTLSSEELEWLEAHNSRRQYWHAYFNTEFSAICWDNTLAAQAQYYADYLASTCQAKHDMSKPSKDSWQYCRQAGENLAFDSSNRPGYRSPYDITISWTDEEFLDLNMSPNHFTQVLWRTSKYLGCATAHNPDCSWKNVAVCRYVRYGNCNCSGDCRDQMLSDSSYCGPFEVAQSLNDYTTCLDDWYE